jgi:glycosyltransferase involved in cell wall biosynthesis
VRIAFDGLHLFGAEYAGIQGSALRAIGAYRRLFAEDEVVLYVPKDFQRPREAFTGKAAPCDAEGAAPAPGHSLFLPEDDRRLLLQRTWFSGRRRTLRTIWRAVRLQAAAYRDHCDLLHGLTYHLPPTLSLPSVLTIHDVIAVSQPQFCTPGSARTQSAALRRSASIARRIQTPTAAVKEEVREILEVPGEKIDVVPWAAGDEFRANPDRNMLEEARRRLALPERYVLFVGNLEPKKNLELLVQAFYAAKMHRKLPQVLVLCGRIGWKSKDLLNLIRDLSVQDCVRLTGYVPAAALPWMYNLAELFVFPSLAEGFGLPLLEAFACGCPALAADIPALREIAATPDGQTAARLINVFGDKPLAVFRSALEDLLADSKEAEMERCRLRKLGLQRAAAFSWQQTAKLMRASYEKALY